MKQNTNWEDLRLFLAVARAGGLAGAAQAVGVSAATLGRRVTALERSLETRLVEREARGYRLTAAGRDLLDQLEEMDQAARAIDQWRASGRTRRKIRISAGDWTMRLLAGHVEAFWSPEAAWQPEFLADLRDRNVARRQIEIGVRNRRPAQEWLAGQKVGTVTFAAYQAAHIPASADLGWAGLVEEEAHVPSALWLKEQQDQEITVSVNKTALALPLVRKGLVRMVLPCFVGDAFEDLKAISAPIAALQSERWLVTHHDQRHDPEIRKVVSSLAKFLRQDPALNPDL